MQMAQSGGVNAFEDTSDERELAIEADALKFVKTMLYGRPVGLEVSHSVGVIHVSVLFVVLSQIVFDDEDFEVRSAGQHAEKIVDTLMSIVGPMNANIEFAQRTPELLHGGHRDIRRDNEAADSGMQPLGQPQVHQDMRPFLTERLQRDPFERGKGNSEQRFDGRQAVKSEATRRGRLYGADAGCKREEYRRRGLVGFTSTGQENVYGAAHSARETILQRFQVFRDADLAP